MLHSRPFTLSCLVLRSSTYDCPQMTFVVPYKPSAKTYRKHVTWSLSNVVWRHCLRGSVFTEPLPKTGCITPLFHCWWVYYLETVVSVAQPFLHGANTPQYYAIFISWGGVRLGPLSTLATNWPIVTTLDDRWVWSIWRNENWQEKPKYSEKTCLTATLLTTNPIFHDRGSNTSCRDGKSKTTFLSYGTVRILIWEN
jgi:hypothetical protein